MEFFVRYKHLEVEVFVAMDDEDPTGTGREVTEEEAKAIGVSTRMVRLSADEYDVVTGLWREKYDSVMALVDEIVPALEEDIEIIRDNLINYRQFQTTAPPLWRPTTAPIMYPNAYGGSVSDPNYTAGTTTTNFTINWQELGATIGEDNGEDTFE